MIFDLDILFSDEFGRAVEANLERDPVKIALDGSVPHAAVVASQVKYLQRARYKLPSYYSARCILPQLAFEQSSSEAAAARKEYSGEAAIDLTCGLGVDSFWLAKRFERVITLERDESLAAIARENFRRLGADNILVIDTSAEDFLSGAGIHAIANPAVAPTHADLVYADPDRRGGNAHDGGNAHGGSTSRNEGKKMVRMEDCSPDIVALLPALRRIAPRLVVKLSPLFDVDEVFRIFRPGTLAEGGKIHGEIAPGPQPDVCVEVVSIDGECKEVVAEITFGPQAAETPAKSLLRAVAIGLGEVEYPHGDGWKAPGLLFEPEKYRFLIVPDVALQKARLARRYFTERGVWIDSDNGYGFSAEKLQNIMGRVLEIESIGPFDPKGLKRRLRAQGIRGVDILKRDFGPSTADIARSLGVREGGATKIAFTKAAGRLWQITLKR